MGRFYDDDRAGDFADAHEDWRDNRGFDDDEDFDIEFADPGGNSALRASGPNNPRNLPCPSCGDEDVLTPADRARGYCCDRCANARERGYDI